jgi:hypothetical protein
MRRTRIAVLGVALVLGMAAGAGPAGAKQASVKVDCKNGGWQYLADSAGKPFKNQGACVSFVAKGGVPQPRTVQLTLVGSGIATVDAEFGALNIFHQISTYSLSGQVVPGGSVAGVLHVEASSDGNDLLPPPEPNNVVLTLTGGTIYGHLATFSPACVVPWCGQYAGPGYTLEVTSTIAVESGTGQFGGFTTGTLTLHYVAVLNGFGPSFTEDLTDATVTGTLTP